MQARYATISAALILALAFVVAPAAAQTAAVATDRWEERMQAFEADAPTRPEGAIVLTGSSSFARWLTMEADLAPLTVIPRGFGGSQMSDVLNHVDRLVLPYKPRAVAIYEGDNDSFGGDAPETVAGELKQIIAKIHAELPDTRIYVLSVKPSLARVSVWDRAQATSALYQKIVDSDERLHYIDVVTPFLKADGKVMDDVFVDDGLHLNDKGNAIWAAAIKAALMPIEAQYETTNDE
ncbi:MAG: GDSL-type esterase/lipase family protein [Acidobacteria bacterium]|nr:GDSL-type esterase/lipase family protein [Acidobacteriota bacterium]